jgi:hypothetical protein
MAKTSVLVQRAVTLHTPSIFEDTHLVIVEELGKRLGEGAVEIAGGIFSGITPLKEPKIS